MSWGPAIPPPTLDVGVEFRIPAALGHDLFPQVLESAVMLLGQLQLVSAGQEFLFKFSFAT